MLYAFESLNRLARALAGRDLVVEVRLALKMTAGATAAWWLAVELGARRPIFAALVPLVAMTGDPFAAVSVSLSRIVGVFAGVGVGIAVVHLSVGSTVRVAIALLAGTLAGVVLKVGDRPNLEVPIAALFLIGYAGGVASHVGGQRIWETALGAAIAIVVSSLVWPPDPVRKVERDLEALRLTLAADLAAIADDLATGSGEAAARLDDVRAHSLDAIRDVFEIAAARRALRWSPLRRGDAPQVDELARRINLGARVYRHARALARDVADTAVRDARLASATRDLADAADRSLDGTEPAAPLERAGATIGAHFEGEAWIVAAQLRQLHADVSAAMRQETGEGYGSRHGET